MRSALALVLLLASAPVAHAQELAPSAPTSAEVQAAPVPSAEAAPTLAERRESPIARFNTEPAAGEEATLAAAQMPSNFWWTVGAIVLGGLILIVIVD